MSQENTRNVAGEAAEMDITVAAPAAGQHLDIPAVDGAARINLAFDPSEATDVAQQGNDLVFTFENGGTVAITDFFEFVDQESDVNFALPDGAEAPAGALLAAFDIALPEPAAGPAAGSASAGVGAYNADPGSLLAGVGRLGMLDPFRWGGGAEDDTEDYFAIPSLTVTTGSGGLFLSASDYNESDNTGLFLNLELSMPAPAEIVVTIRVGGNINFLETPGMEEFNADMSLPGGTFPGGSYTFDPVTGILTITLPAGSMGGQIGMDVFDDHISEADLEQVTFEVIDTAGPVSGGIGQSATVDFTEDDLDSHSHDDAANELFVKDGPVIGLESVSYSRVEEPELALRIAGDGPVYEGSATKGFGFLINLTDPHTGDSYLGYTNTDGSTTGVLSQDLHLTLNANGGSAEAGADFYLVPSDALMALIESGAVEVALDDDGRIITDEDGSFEITILGRLDDNGLPHDPQPESLFSLPEDLPSLVVGARVVPNNDESEAGEDGGAEDIVLSVTDVRGNESSISEETPAVEVGIDADPVLSLQIDADSVNESEGSFSATLTFDKPVDWRMGFEVELSVSDPAPTLWNGEADTKFEADFFLPGTEADGSNVVFDAEAGTITVTDDNGVTYTAHLDEDGNLTSITVSGDDASLFDGGLTATFPLNDDHISESDESLGLEIESVTLTDSESYDGSGNPVTGAVSIDEENNSDSIAITEDTVTADGDGTSESAEKDGPLVGVEVDKASISEGAVAGSNTFTFNVTLTDPHSGDEYAGFENDGLLSQDMTLTLTVGSVTSGDFTLDFSKLDALEDAGMLSYTYNEATGELVINLHGRVDADGDLHTEEGREAFDLSELGNLTLTATVVDDTTAETAETITVTVDSVNGGNEAVVDEDNNSASTDINEYINGPVCSVAFDKSSVTESGSPEDAAALVDNTTWCTISLDANNSLGQNVPTGGTAGKLLATEKVVVELTVSSGNTGTNFLGEYGTDTNITDTASQFDANWASLNTWQLVIDGTAFGADTVTGPVDGLYTVTFDNGDSITVSFDGNVAQVTVEPGVINGHSNVDIKAGIEVSDDMWEQTGKTGDLDAELALVTKPGSADDGGTDKPWGEAQLDPNKDTSSTTINPDARGGDLNPDDFDGPWLTLTHTGMNGAGNATDKNIDETSEREDGKDNLVNFELNLSDPAGGAAAYEAQETVSVTLKLTGSTGSVDINDFFAPGESRVISYSYTIDGVETTGTVAINGNLQFTLNIPAGASGIKFDVPINDDPLGGDDDSANLNAGNKLDDLTSESFGVEVVSVTGNETRVDTEAGDDKSGNVTITDDVLEDGFEGVTVGLDFSGTRTDTTAGAPNTGTTGSKPGSTVADGEDSRDVVFEGNTYPIKLSIFGDNGALLVAGNNPYAGYATGTNALPDDLVITLNFNGGGASGSDMTLKPSAALLALITAGTVVITPALNADGSLQNGEFTLTIKAGSNIVDVSGKLGFDASINADNVNEWDNLQDYLNGTGADEQWNLEITKVEGNESKIADQHEVQAQNSDRADGQVDVGGGNLNEGADGWSFGLKVSYGTDKNADGTDKNPDGSASGDAELKTTPEEAVHLRINVADSATMQRGEEYNVDEFSLFLSLNKLTPEAAAALGITDAESYEAWLAETLADYDGDPLAACEGEDLILVDEVGDYSKGTPSDPGSSNFDVYAPKDALADGQLDFDIAAGESGGFSNQHDGFGVSVVDPYDGENAEYDIKGEIINTGELLVDDGKAETDNKPTDGVDDGVAHAIVGEKIYVNLTGSKTIQEDPEGDNVDDFTVTFKDASGQSFGPAAANIRFNLALNQTTAKLDANTTDNDLVNNRGDFAFCDAAGNPLVYNGISESADGTTPSLLDALNAYLEETYGCAPDGEPYVQIMSITDLGGQLNFQVDVREGFDLGQGISLKVSALDDGHSDSGESFNMRISSPESYTEGDTAHQAAEDSVKNPLDLCIPAAGGNTHTTGIQDESAGGKGSLNGFAVGLEPGEGWEHNMTGHETDVVMPVRAYILGDDGQIMSIDALKALFVDNGGAVSVDAVDITSAEFRAFIEDNYAPTQSITVGIADANNTAVTNQDYVDPDASFTIGKDEWELVINEDGSIYFRNADNVRIESIDDFLLEDNESFDVTLTGTSGNEARPLTDEESAKVSDEGNKVQVGDSVTGTVHDVWNGPVLDHFGPAEGVVYEPIDLDHGANDKAGTSPAKVGQFEVSLDSAVSEPVAVWMSLKQDETADANKGFAEVTLDENGLPTLGGDFAFGEGIYYYDAANDTVFTFGDGVPTDTGLSLEEFWQQETGEAMPDYVKAPEDGGLFTIIDEGQSAGNFEVIVQDDNRNEDESIGLVINDMQGSEVRYHDEESGKDIPFAEKTPTDGIEAEAVLADEGAGKEGPEVGLLMPTDLTGQALANYMLACVDNRDVPDGFNLDMTGKCDEDVTVTITIYSAQTGAPLGTVTATIPAGETSLSDEARQALWDEITNVLGGSENPAPGSDWGAGDFFLSVSESSGGETAANSEPILVDTWGYDGDVYLPITLDSFNSTGDIHENAIPGEAGDTAGFEFTFNTHTQIGEGGGPVDISFNLNFVAGTAGADDLVDTNSVNVTISKEMFEDLGITDNTEFTLTVTPTYDEDGNLTGYETRLTTPAWTGGESLDVSDYVTINGNFPTAVGDNKLEGDEDFFTMVTGASGVDVNDGVADTTIKNETKVGLVLLVDDGNGNLIPLDQVTKSEGTELNVIAKLVLVDAAGNPIDAEGNPVEGGNYVEVTSDLPLEFDVNYPDGSLAGINQGTEESDFSGTGSIRINPGESDTSFTVTIHEDNYSEGATNPDGTKSGDEQFGVTVELSDESKAVLEAEGAADSYVERNAGGTVTIADNQSGPEIRWTMDDASVAETGTITISLESYDGGIRTVVDEAVEVSFQITPNADNGISLDDIQSITVDGVTYINGGEPSLNDLLSGPTEGPWVFNNTFENGLALDELQIKFNNDTVREPGNEGFTLKVTQVVGSEASYDDAAKDVTVSDVVNGPTVGIKAGEGSEHPAEGDNPAVTEVNVIVTFTGGEPTDEESFVTLTLDEGARDRFTGDMDDITLDGIPGATVESYNPESGELVIRLPEDVKSGDNLEVTFSPIKDNSLDGSDWFGVGLSKVTNPNTGINNGELQMESVNPRYTGSWAGERAGAGIADAGSNTVKIVTSQSNLLKDLEGSADVTVSGLGAGENIVKTVFITVGTGADAERIEVEPYHPEDNPNGWEWNEDGSITIHDQGISGQYVVEVVYLPDADPARVAAAKGNAGDGSVVVEAGKKVYSEIKSEEDAEFDDGPVASIAFDQLTGAEGEELGGTLTVDMHSLAGDRGELEEDLILTLTLSPNADGTYSEVEGINLPEGATWQQVLDAHSNPTGEIKVTIPKGTEIPDGDQFDLNFTVEVDDNSLLDNPNLKLEITGFEGGSDQEENEGQRGYEKLEIGEAVAEAVITDDKLSGPNIVVGVTGGAPAEGGTIHFTLDAGTGNDANWADVTVGTEVSVQLELTGYMDGDSISFDGATLVPYEVDGKWYVDVSIGKDSAADNMVEYLYYTTRDDSTAGERSIGVSVVGKAGDQVFEQVSGGKVTVVIRDEAPTDAAVEGVRFGVNVTPAAGELAASFTLAASLLGMLGTEANAALPEEVTLELTFTGPVGGTLYIDGVEAGIFDENGSCTWQAPALAAGTVIPDDLPTYDLAVLNENGQGVGANIGITVSGVETADPIPGTSWEAYLANGAAQTVAVDNSYYVEHGADGDQHEATEDVVIIGGSENGILVGGAGNDILYGGNSDNIMAGGAGNDTLYVCSGESILAGGDGEDLFVWNGSSLGNYTSTITDFEYNSDGLILGGGILGNDDDALNNLLLTPKDGSWNADDKTLTIENGEMTLTATFEPDGQLGLSIDMGDNTQQINVTFNEAGGCNAPSYTDIDEAAARAILESMIKGCTM